MNQRKLPDSNLFSDKFWTRAFAVFGHYLAAHLAIMLGLALGVAIVGIILSGVSPAFGGFL